ncbi:hypothetical protein MJO28_015433 [Puccinia striiformis f. sp. tritici]|uniref:Uncharacterized protein n=1 Tax=Puccinia striiformis f. sp. tritici TaxID=168172 RepID=A0ACC0DUB0_9BASI|nr:hypothetical protein MJO29_015143 [Puccinia striiformis f. sp. tritici]KAI7938513.1 hypothetical protein MJO28_015433 [Puccinia striiformis f. sp. tritici]KAI9627961.1 hypothetical protein KEM48_011898 [Puccinia striiformis f. sp. tritici PST-130]
MISKVLIPLVNLYYVLAFLLTNHIVFAPKTPQPPPQPAPQPLPRATSTSRDYRFPEYPDLDIKLLDKKAPGCGCIIA